jgi:hypothetical protein
LFTKETNKGFRHTKHKGSEVDSLGAFVRFGESGLHFCGDGQSGLAAFFAGTFVALAVNEHRLNRQ